jgi:hypothetical protein
MQCERALGAMDAWLAAWHPQAVGNRQ